MIVSIIFLTFYIVTYKIAEQCKYGYEIMEVFKDLSISTIAAWIFFYFQVYIPQKQKNASLKNLLVKKWKTRKDRILFLFWEEMWRIKQIKEETPSNDFIEKISNFRDFRSFCDWLQTWYPFGWREYINKNLNSRFSNWVLQQFDGFLQDLNQSLSLGVLGTHSELPLILIEFEQIIDTVKFWNWRYLNDWLEEQHREQIIKDFFFKVFLSRDKGWSYLDYDWIEDGLSKIGN